MLHSPLASVVAMTADLEYVVETNHIGFDIGIRILNAISDPRLGGKIYDNIKLILIKQRTKKDLI